MPVLPEQNLHDPLGRPVIPERRHLPYPASTAGEKRVVPGRRLIYYSQPAETGSNCNTTLVSSNHILGPVLMCFQNRGASTEMERINHPKGTRHPFRAEYTALIIGNY